MSIDPIQPPQGWHQQANLRINPPPPSERGLLFRGLSPLVRGFGRKDVPTLFPVLNIHRGLFPAWLWFASRLMPFGRLPAPVRELLILRTGWNCRCRYEWGQHVALSLREGMSDADILASTLEPTACDDAGKRLLLEACDELCLNNKLSDATWEALRQRWCEADVIEIMMLVGHYTLLAGVLNSLGLILEAPVEECLQAFWNRIDTR